MEGLPVVYWLRLRSSNAEDLGSISAQGTRSHMPQLRVHIPQLNILNAATKTWHSKQVYIYVCMCAKLLQSCLTLCDPMDCSPTDSSVHGILQARILEWLPFPPPGDLRLFPTQGLNPRLLCLLHWQASSLPIVPPGKPYIYIYTDIEINGIELRFQK